MKEIKEIARAYDEAQRNGEQTALATVVHLEGSAYRRPGARMLITENGRLTGAISGGCLEGDALRKAQLVMIQKKPMLVTYDTTDEDDAKFGAGLGCNGVITILIEPVDKDDTNNPVQLLKTLLSRRQTAALVTLFSLHKKSIQYGTSLLAAEDGKIKGSLPDEALQSILIKDAQKVLSTGAPVIKKYVFQNELTAFIEIVKPAVSLVVFGAGNDSLPLAQMANVLGWETTIADGRPNYARKDRFPDAHRVVVLKPENVLSEINFDARTAVVLLTHNYDYDMKVLRQLLPLHIIYIGVLGPKKKLDRMLHELNEEGIAITKDNIPKVFGPAGLDIGAETADEIALSILSEIQAVLSKRTGTFLREKAESIHSREIQKIVEIH